MISPCGARLPGNGRVGCGSTEIVGLRLVGKKQRVYLGRCARCRKRRYFRRDPRAAALALPLTTRQREVLTAIGAFVEAHGYPPSHRELGAALGIGSTNRVHDLLATLERKGAITRDPKIARSIRLREATAP